MRAFFAHIFFIQKTHIIWIWWYIIENGIQRSQFHLIFQMWIIHSVISWSCKWRIIYLTAAEPNLDWHQSTNLPVVYYQSNACARLHSPAIMVATEQIQYKNYTNTMQNTVQIQYKYNANTVQIQYWYNRYEIQMSVEWYWHVFWGIIIIQSRPKTSGQWPLWVCKLPLLLKIQMPANGCLYFWDQFNWTSCDIFVFFSHFNRIFKSAKELLLR